MTFAFLFYIYQTIDAHICEAVPPLSHKKYSKMSSRCNWEKKFKNTIALEKFTTCLLDIFQVPTFAKKKPKSPHCAMISVASEKVGFVLAIRLKREPNVVVKFFVCWIIYIFARFTYSLMYITKNGN